MCGALFWQQGVQDRITFALCCIQGTTGQKRKWDNWSSKRQVSVKMWEVVGSSVQDTRRAMLVIIIG